MGFAKVPHELRNHLHELTGSQLKVWLCHLLHEDKNHTSFPSVPLIAKETGLDADTVGDAHKWLRENGWLKTVGSRDSKTGKFAVPVGTCAIPVGVKTRDGVLPSRYKTVTVPTVDGSTVDGFDPPEVDTCEVDTFEADTKTKEDTVTPNQSTNQPTNYQETATPPPSSPPSEETPTGVLKLFEDGVEVWVDTGDRVMSPMEKEQWVRGEMANLWWDYRNPREQNLRLMYEALRVCQTKHLMAKELKQYSEQHFGHKQKTRGMVIRSPRDLWRSLCGPKVSQTNGLIAQYNQCLMEPCKDCKRTDGPEKATWVNPNLEAHARYPVAPPPPPMATCGDCGAKFEATRSTARTNRCVECEQKKEDASFLKLLLAGRVKPTDAREIYERLLKAGKIPDEVKTAAVAQRKSSFAAFETDEL